MTDALPHLDDPLVLAMARHNHTPIEVWTHGAGVKLDCRQDGQAWPCATRTAIEVKERTDKITAPAA